MELDVWGDKVTDHLNVRLKNKTNLELEIKISPGTILYPQAAGPQRMVVRRYTKIELGAGLSNEFEVETYCMDISKRTPYESDKLWKTSWNSDHKKFVILLDKYFIKNFSDVKSVDMIKQWVFWRYMGATDSELAVQMSYLVNINELPTMLEAVDKILEQVKSFEQS